jgi:hypothetical protein
MSKHYCKQCGQEYTPRRSTSQFCSASCRSAHGKGVSAPVSAPTELAHPVSAPLTDCQHVQQATRRGINTVNLGAYRNAAELGKHEVNRVSLPGDADYTGAAVL